MNKVLKFGMLVGLFSLLVGCANTAKQPSFALGEISKTNLLTTYQSFSTPYEQFTVSTEEQLLIKQWPSNIHIEVFFGTWCHDSQREVPRLLKLLSYTPTVDHQLIALDYQKSDPKDLAKNKGIKYTPTIILYKNNKEIGRVIERPTNSLVLDINEMINFN